MKPIPGMVRIRSGRGTLPVYEKALSAQEKRMRRLAEVLDEARGIGVSLADIIAQEHADMTIEEINALGVAVRAAITAKEKELGI